MFTIQIPDELAERLKEKAARENRSVEEITLSLIEQHLPAEQPDAVDDIEQIIGVFDDDITDLSMTVRETLDDYYKKKYGRPD